MTLAASIATEHDLTAYTSAAKLVAATSVTSGHISGGGHGAMMRSYAGSPALESTHLSWQMPQAPSALSDAVEIVVGPARPEDVLIDELAALRRLAAGWDGERAASPASAAIRDAVRFVRAAGSLATRLEPTVHVDGSIVLEIEDGAEGSFRFKGDGRVVFATEAGGLGAVTFDGLALPDQVERALGA